VVPKLLKGLNFVLFRCILPYEAGLDGDVQLDHYALGVVIHPNVRIGRNVRIYHQVTLASETWIGSEHLIIIGDDVLLGAGAKIIARGDRTLRIGNGASVGANAVVTGDVADGEIVVGVPARPVTRPPASD